MLSGGDRRSLGRSDEVLSLITRKNIAQLVGLLEDDDPVVRMRASDVVEKISRDRVALLNPFKPLFFELLASATQKEMRWHLALIVPRLDLTRAEVHRAAELLVAYQNDTGSIVKTLALQGLADLARRDASLKPMVADMLRLAARSGTAAMRARARILLKG
jgi:hypothetical protein